LTPDERIRLREIMEIPDQYECATVFFEEAAEIQRKKAREE